MRIVVSFALGLGEENEFGWRGKCHILHLEYDGKIVVSSGAGALSCDFAANFAGSNSCGVSELSWHFGVWIERAGQKTPIAISAQLLLVNFGKFLW